MSRVTIWTAILVASAGTYVFRASFLAAAARVATVPPLVQRLLRQIPPAVFAALVAPAVVRPDGALDLWQPRLAAAAVAGLAGWRTRNVGVTLVVGLTTLALLEWLTG